MPDHDPESTAELLDDQIVSLAPQGDRPVRPGVWWLAIGAALAIAVAVGVSFASRPGPEVALVASPSPNATDRTAIASIEPSPTADANLCAEGGFDVQPASVPVPSGDLGPLRLTQPGALALAIEENRAGGSIIVARSHGDEAGAIDASVVARFTGYDIELGRAVTPVAWWGLGDAILVNVGYLSDSEPQHNCNDLFLVWADGSHVIRLTHNRPGEWASASSLSPSGGKLARVAAGDLRLVDVATAEPGVALASCVQPAGPVRWSPDGEWLVVVCHDDIVVIDLVGQRPHIYGPSSDAVVAGSLAKGSVPLAAGWTADGDSIVAVAAQAGPSQLGPLQIAVMERADGTPISQIETGVVTEWVVDTPILSPDGRWALVQGDGSVTPARFFPTYAVDTSTGVATKLPWTVIHDSTGPSSVNWLPEPARFLYAEDQALYEVDLATMTRTEVGAVPAEDIAWYAAPP
jgi:hypothetical protein